MIEIRLFLFSCGQGDTILINARDEPPAPGVWALVDCNLGKNDGSLDRFLEFVETHDARRLDLVMQTHADLDHFRGMIDVLRHFQEKRDGVRLYIDGGLEPKQAQAILVDHAVYSAYAKLQNYLTDLAKAKRLKLMTVDVERGAIDLTDDPGQVEIVPLFPTSTYKRCEEWKQFLRAGNKPTTKLDSNLLAIVMALNARASGRDFHALLASDADPPAVRESLKFWSETEKRSARFDVVKVPHHGSIKSHADELARAGRNSDHIAVAAISCGNGRIHPDRYVLDRFLANKWLVMATMTRRSTKQWGNLSVEVAGRKPLVLFRQHDLVITWSPDRGMDARPADAQVLDEHLECYDTAER